MNEVKRNARRKSAGSHRSGGTSSRDDREWQWHRIQGWLEAQTASGDRERLRSLLLACGVVVGGLVAALIAVKMFPVTVTILTILGLALLLWGRCLACPF